MRGWVCGRGVFRRPPQRSPSKNVGGGCAWKKKETFIVFRTRARPSAFTIEALKASVGRAYPFHTAEDFSTVVTAGPFYVTITVVGERRRNDISYLPVKRVKCAAAGRPVTIIVGAPAVAKITGRI